MQAEENIKLASMDLGGRRCTDAVEGEGYVQKPRTLFAVTSKRVFFKGGMRGTSLKPSRRKLFAPFMITAVRRAFYSSRSFIHSEHTVLAEPRVRLPSGGSEMRSG